MNKEQYVEGLGVELLDMICETCNVEPPPEGQISVDTPLIGPDSWLGLDSLDAMEIVVTLQKKYGVRINSEQTSRQVLESLATLTQFVSENKSK